MKDFSCKTNLLHYICYSTVYKILVPTILSFKGISKELLSISYWQHANYQRFWTYVSICLIIQELLLSKTFRVTFKPTSFFKTII